MGCDMSRMELYDRLPLESPLSIHVFPIFYCNLQCQYCLHSLNKVQLEKMGFQKQSMKFEVYQKMIDDLVLHGWHLKALIFAGHGEPLLHKDIAAMVAYAKEKYVADRVEIVTNGTLLTQELSDALIHAGVDRLRISLQGVTADQYKTMSGVWVDMERFAEQLRYFYQQKRNTEVYIKIIDLALKNQGDYERFEAFCQGTADTHAIEYAIPFVQEIDLGALSGNCKQGNRQGSNICSMPFYMMVLLPSGDIAPCCAITPPRIFGNVLHNSLKSIWESDKRREFLLKQLEGYTGIPVCEACTVPQFGLQEGDYLDGHEDELKKIYLNRRWGGI